MNWDVWPTFNEALSFNIPFIKRDLISIGRKMRAMWYKLQVSQILMLI